MKATIESRYELKDCVYTISRGRIIYGEIYRIKAEISHILERSEWKMYYDMQISESDSLYNVPEAFVYATLEEAETSIRQ